MNRMQNAIKLPLHLVNRVNPVDVLEGYFSYPQITPITQICTVQ
jgi:hypothetical protein